MSKVVGVLGGMGPLATVEFLRLLMDATPARKDWDHLRTIVDIHPQIPSRSRHHLYGEPSPVPGMIEACRRLAAYPVDFIVVPCNSASAFIAEVAPQVSVPIENIVDATAAELAGGAHQRIAVMGGVVTYERSLYQPALARHGMSLANHDEPLQRRVEALIELLKTHGATPEGQRELEAIAQELVAQTGAEHLILGCTELAMLDRTTLAIPATDSAEALARRTVRLARGDVDAR
jgi:aspartate racemase